ncbi:DNA-binding transcriptional LysR family regulator [Hamadaea flava]|uniref:LysR family transcriptional regulator n=1 Tax=Hamadaea flava TaxID=1742688 RepID=A0ABV8LPV0_9ACTN|nr:LysR family transcriptional regulator [Hamadaea flava]MCP2322913.1 DNA-binding transcriptional LysR family regulator [Hamadaea flava]
MDLFRHLRYFVVTAEEMHFGRAADRLGIAQPPLSQSIQRLERELEVELFDRSRRRIELTAAGRLLLDEARTLLAGEERLRSLMRLARDGHLGTLRAGVQPDTPPATLQALLRELSEQAPGLDVDLQELTTGEQVRLLTEARLDVGLISHPVDAPDLRFGPPVTVALGVLVPRLSPLARLGTVRLSDLAGQDLVLPPRATAPGWHDHVLEVCRDNGFVPNRVRHASNSEFLLGLVLAGRGVAIEPESAARREPRVVWRALDGSPLRRTVSAAWPAQSPHPAAERFGRVAAETLAGPSPTAQIGPVTAPRPWTVVFTPSYR